MPIPLLLPLAVGASALVGWVGWRWWRTGEVSMPAPLAFVPRADKDPSKLEPAFRAKVEALLGALRARGHRPVIAEAWRSQARQDALYAQGRTRPGVIVTWTTDSEHTRGRAVDLIDGRPHPTRSGEIVGWGSWTGSPGDDVAKAMADDFYEDVGELAEDVGLVWGGTWSNPDKAHVQARSEVTT